METGINKELDHIIINFRELKFGKTIAVGLAAFTFGTTAYASEMTDIEHHWAGTAIAKMAGAHHLSGYPDGTFKPDLTISRAEFVTMANQTFDMGLAANKTTTSFRDVQPSDWYYPQVAAAEQAGYIQGYDDNTFQPGNEVTRVEAAVIMTRLLHLDSTKTGTLHFTDAGSIPEWAASSVSAAVYGKVFDGYEDGAFQPASKLTRAEAAVALQRALDASHASVPTPPESPAIHQSETIVSVSAVDGQLTITFNHALAANPALSDFSVIQSQNGGVASPVIPTAIHWNADLTAATLDVSKQNVGLSSLSVVFGVSYKGGAIVNAPTLTLTVSAGGGGGGGESTQALVSAASAQFDGLVVTSVTAIVDPNITKVEIWRGAALLVSNVVPSGNAIAASLVGVAVNDVLTLKPYISSSMQDNVNVTVQ